MEPPDSYLLKVTDNGMMGDGICEGDIVRVVEIEPKENDIAALLTQSGFLFRRIQRHAGRYLLIPSDRLIPIQEHEHINIVGVVVEAHICF